MQTENGLLNAFCCWINVKVYTFTNSTWYWRPLGSFVFATRTFIIRVSQVTMLQTFFGAFPLMCVNSDTPDQMQCLVSLLKKPFSFQFLWHFTTSRQNCFIYKQSSISDQFLNGVSFRIHNAWACIFNKLLSKLPYMTRKKLKSVPEHLIGA